MAAVVAGLAGAPGSLALLIGASMLLLQLAIGAANDWADAPADARVRPDKPIPAGLVARAEAAVVATLCAAAGLALAAIAGPLALAIAVAGLACGLAYDLRLKSTPWSWLPYAIGIPLLPLFGWAGATGALPPALLVFVPIAAGAGAALAIANALADLDRDAAAGLRTVATALGPARARLAAALLLAAVLAGALGSLVVLGGGGAAIGVAAGGAVVAIVGVAVGWTAGPVRRRRAWEIQALGLGLVAAGWFAALATAVVTPG